MAAKQANQQLPIVPLVINNKSVSTSKTFPVSNPATGEQIWHCASASKNDAVAAAEAAQAAFAGWAQTKPTERRDIFLKAAQIMNDRAEELAGYMIAETGCEPSWATGLNVPFTCNVFREVAGRCSSVGGNVVKPMKEGQNAMVLQEPWGVILGIAPWLVSLLIRVLLQLPQKEGIF